MPEIHPLRAVTFAANAGRDVSTRIAPPYDVLDEQPKRRLLDRDPHNIVAIDLPVTPPKTVGPDSAYEQAASLYQQWLREGVLQQHDRPCLFAYEQQYAVAGDNLRRRGLFAGVSVEPFNQPSGVFRHEHTLPGGVNDRYKLMAASQAQFSPVFGVFSDPNASVVGRLAPWFDRDPDLHGTTGHDGVTHRLWRVDDPAVLDAIRTFFREAAVYIADGHHRYTTAQKFREDHPQLTGAKACLMVLVAAEDPGMIVLPYHRVVRGMTGFSIAALQKALASRDDLQLTPSEYSPAQLQPTLAGHGYHAMGLYDARTKSTWVLSTTQADPLARSHSQEPDAWRTLDVAILQHLVLEGVLKPAFGGDAISYAYTADLQELAELTHAEPGRLGVIMQATPLQSVMQVSDAGAVMPPKSTFFYPKLATGLVINPLA